MTHNQPAYLMRTFHFEQELIQNTTKSVKGCRVFTSNVLVAVERINGNEIKITRLETARGPRRIKDCLMWLCEMADGHNVSLIIDPLKLENKEHLDLLILVEWYKQFGFERLGLGNQMMRKPHDIDHSSRVQETNS